MRVILPVFALLALASCAPDSSSDQPGYVVFFTERSAEIDTAGLGLIRSAADRSNAGALPVTVVGWTDSAGSPSADILLSQTRARHVAEALVADGVPADRITRRGRGQTREDPGVASRRVNIEVGSGGPRPGMGFTGRPDPGVAIH